MGGFVGNKPVEMWR